MLPAVPGVITAAFTCDLHISYTFIIILLLLVAGYLKTFYQNLRNDYERWNGEVMEDSVRILLIMRTRETVQIGFMDVRQSY